MRPVVTKDRLQKRDRLTCCFTLRDVVGAQDQPSEFLVSEVSSVSPEVESTEYPVTGDSDLHRTVWGSGARGQPRQLVVESGLLLADSPPYKIEVVHGVVELTAVVIRCHVIAGGHAGSPPVPELSCSAGSCSHNRGRCVRLLAYLTARSGGRSTVCETRRECAARVSDRVQPATGEQGRGMAEQWSSAVLDAVNSVVEDLQKTMPRKTYGGTSLGESALSASGAGGRFVFPDVGAARKIRTRFEDRLDSIRARQKLIRKAEFALQERFAEDPESIGYRDGALNSLLRLDELNESMFKYTENYIEKINKAISAMRAIDDDSARALGGSAKDVHA